jgi:membrane protease YdiL (CAAX protease family)
MCYLGLLGVVGFATIAGDAIDVRGYLVVDAAFAAIVLAFAVVFRRAIVPLLRLPRMDAHSWILMVAGPAVVWLVNRAVILAISGIPQAFVSDPAVELRAAGASTATVLFFLCVTPPIFEEIAFRGILLEAMRESFGARSAAVVVAVLFSILHVAILSFVPLAGLGVLLAVLRLRSASLWPAVVAHALYNLPGAVWT